MGSEMCIRDRFDGGLERGIDLTLTLGIFKRDTEVIATWNYTKGSDTHLQKA